VIPRQNRRSNVDEHLEDQGATALLCRCVRKACVSCQTCASSAFLSCRTCRRSSSSSRTASSQASRRHQPPHQRPMDRSVPALQERLVGRVWPLEFSKTIYELGNVSLPASGQPPGSCSSPDGPSQLGVHQWQQPGPDRPARQQHLDCADQKPSAGWGRAGRRPRTASPLSCPSIPPIQACSAIGLSLRLWRGGWWKGLGGVEAASEGE